MCNDSSAQIAWEEPLGKESKLTAIILEEEQACRERLRRLLQRHEDRLQILAEVDRGHFAVELCNKHRPNVLFLDVSLPGIDGFGVLEQIPGQTRAIVMTAQAADAARAFRVNAVDCLLKPIHAADLDDALARTERLVNSSSSSTLVRLLCRDRDKTHVVQTAQVLFLRAEGGYTHVQTRDDYYLTNEPLASFERQLASSFVRVHRSTLVNVNHVVALKQGEGDLVAILSSEHEIAVSRRHSQEFRRMLAFGT